MDLVLYLIHSLFLFFIFRGLFALFQNSKNKESMSKSPEALEVIKTPIIEKIKGPINGPFCVIYPLITNLFSK